MKVHFVLGLLNRKTAPSVSAAICGKIGGVNRYIQFRETF